MTTVRVIKFQADTWNFSSENDAFFRQINGEWQRFLTDQDYKRLEDACQATDWNGMDGVNAHLKDHGIGTCYGMALLTVMHQLGMFRASDLDPAADTLYQLRSNNDTVLSAINLHHLLQYRESDQMLLHKTRPANALLDSLLAGMDAGKPALLILCTDQNDTKQRHAVVAVDYQPENTTLVLWNENWKFDGYIRFYDPKTPHTEKRLYVNRSEHKWYSDAYQGFASGMSNIGLRAVVTDLGILTSGSPYADSEAAVQEQPLTQMTFETEGKYKMPQWVDPTTGMPISGSGAIDSVVVEQSLFDISGDSSRNLKKYTMLYETDEYKFSFADEKSASAQVEMKYPGKLCYIQSDLLNDAVFAPNGVTAHIQTSDYTLRFVQNLAKDANGFSLLAVKGTGDGKVEFHQHSKDSWILSADKPLGTLEISAKSRTGEEVKSVQTTSKKVCIYATPDGEISILYYFDDSEGRPAENGDVNIDGKISVEDAQLALKHYTATVAGIQSGLPEENQIKMDVNGDGECSVDDAQLILMYYTQKTVAQNDITWEDLLHR